MAVWGYSRKYIGLSTDDKPVTTTEETIPTGSSFYENDTGKTAYWDGSHWMVRPDDLLIVDRLDTLITEIRALKDLHLMIAAKL